MALSRRFGSAEIIALEDGAGAFFQPRSAAFPEATAAHWQRADQLDPGAVSPDGQWLLRFRCFAVRPDSGRVVLVDAGIGPADAPAASWAPVPGRLPDELVTAGIEPGDVDTVVLTHLHTDHVGWAVTGAARAPYFPNAGYLLQRAEVDAVDALNPRLRERLIDPLRDADQLRIAAGGVRLAPGLRVLATPGHTPGHQSVLLESAAETVLLTGDLLVHAVQLVAPDLPYAHEVDPATARESRVTLLGDLAAGPSALLATPHLSEPFVRLPPTAPLRTASTRPPRPAESI
jgi:glyoxylase-like metal-dependent hydrolase (beta-lactamase superfamily II)